MKKHTYADIPEVFEVGNKIGLGSKLSALERFILSLGLGVGMSDNQKRCLVDALNEAGEKK